MIETDDLIEIPAFVESDGNVLFGILTEPLEHARGVVAIHLRGGNQGPSSGRNRTSVRLCRRLAGDGYHTLRFDYRGVGDSTGSIEQFRHDDTFDGDVRAWVSWLKGRGLNRFILIGECFGARTALACGDISGLEAVVLLALPIRDAEKQNGRTRPLVRHRSLVGYAARAVSPTVLRSLRDPKKRRRYALAAKAALKAPAPPRGSSAGPAWVSGLMLEMLQLVLDRGVRVLLVNGTEDPGFDDFERAKSGRFGAMLLEAGSLVQGEVLQGRLAAWSDTRVQQSTIECIGEWLAPATVDSGGSS